MVLVLWKLLFGPCVMGSLSCFVVIKKRTNKKKKNNFLVLYEVRWTSPVGSPVLCMHFNGNAPWEMGKKYKNALIQGKPFTWTRTNKTK